MLVIAVLLLVGGAVIAYIGRPRERLLYWAGLALFAVGVVLLVLWVFDVTGADDAGHAAAVQYAAAERLPQPDRSSWGAVLFGPFVLSALKWMRARWRGSERQIDPAFARVLAAQVAVGSAPAAGFHGLESADANERARARSSLAVIGLMLANACPDDEVVQETLAMRLEVGEDRGATTLRSVG